MIGRREGRGGNGGGRKGERWRKGKEREGIEGERETIEKMKM